jgi:transcriptional regulator with XRE-family HTH domain
MIRAFRDSQEWTQQELADRVGASLKAVWNWEAGRFEPAGPARMMLDVLAREHNWSPEGVEGDADGDLSAGLADPDPGAGPEPVDASVN